MGMLLGFAVAALLGASVAPAVQAAGPLLNVTYVTNAKGAVAPGAVVTSTITVTNNASSTETARNVTVLNTLPKGLRFRLDASTTSNYPLGDLVPGQSKTLSFEMLVDAKTAPGTYTSIAVAKGDNTEQMTAAAPVDVQKPKVLGETVEAAAAETAPTTEPVKVLAETGPSAFDASIIVTGLALVGAGVLLRRRLA